MRFILETFYVTDALGRGHFVAACHARGLGTQAVTDTLHAFDTVLGGLVNLTVCRRRDSNPRHADYDSAALTS